MGKLLLKTTKKNNLRKTTLRHSLMRLKLPQLRLNKRLTMLQSLRETKVKVKTRTLLEKARMKTNLAERMTKMARTKTPRSLSKPRSRSTRMEL